jgi:hypothetical protein
MARGKSIHVDGETHGRLAKKGSFGETFCDIIKRLLDQADQTELLEQTPNEVE